MAFGLEVLRISYAPPKNQTKQWPTEAQMEGWFPVAQLLQRNHEHEVSTRDRPARTGADARIAESVAIGEVRLALRPYGRANKASFAKSDNLRSGESLRAPSPMGPRIEQALDGPEEGA